MEQLKNAKLTEDKLEWLTTLGAENVEKFVVRVPYGKSSMYYTAEYLANTPLVQLQKAFERTDGELNENAETESNSIEDMRILSTNCMVMKIDEVIVHICDLALKNNAIDQFMVTNLNTLSDLVRLRIKLAKISPEPLNIEI
jgi:hypothetical protein